MLKAYWVEYKNDDWGCVVVAHTARQAKVIFSHDSPVTPEPYENEYIDIRATRLCDLAVPARITEPVLIDSCTNNPWTCLVWNTCWRGENCPHNSNWREERRVRIWQTSRSGMERVLRAD